ncbi:MAG: hypothetical protein H6Q05_4199 [Acidobacteria bacterium]|nr:hypothetical protein [Acidobacteriota bacterium]
MLLVKAQPLLRLQSLLLGLSIVTVDLAEGFQHEPALLGKAGRHLHKVASCVGIAVPHQDFQLLRQLGEVA